MAAVEYGPFNWRSDGSRKHRKEWGTIHEGRQCMQSIDFPHPTSRAVGQRPFLVVVVASRSTALLHIPSSSVRPMDFEHDRQRSAKLCGSFLRSLGLANLREFPPCSSAVLHHQRGYTSMDAVLDYVVGSLNAVLRAVGGGHGGGNQ